MPNTHTPESHAAAPYPSYRPEQIKQWPAGMILAVLFGPDCLNKPEREAVEALPQAAWPEGYSKLEDLPKEGLYGLLNGRYTQAIETGNLSYLAPEIHDPIRGVSHQPNHEINQLKMLYYIMSASYDGRPNNTYHPKSGLLERSQAEEQRHLDTVREIFRRIWQDPELSQKANRIREIAVAAEGQMESHYADVVSAYLTDQYFPLDNPDKREAFQNFRAEKEQAVRHESRDRNGETSDTKNADADERRERFHMLLELLSGFPYPDNYKHIVEHEIELMEQEMEPECFSVALELPSIEREAEIRGEQMLEEALTQHELTRTQRATIAGQLGCKEDEVETYFTREGLQNGEQGEWNEQAQALIKAWGKEAVQTDTRHLHNLISQIRTTMSQTLKSLGHSGKLSRRVENLAGKTLTFPGSGSLPLTGLMMHVLTGCSLNLIDKDNIAVDKSRKLIAQLGELGVVDADRIHVYHMDAGKVRYEKADAAQQLERVTPEQMRDASYLSLHNPEATDQNDMPKHQAIGYRHTIRQDRGRGQDDVVLGAVSQTDDFPEPTPGYTYYRVDSLPDRHNPIGTYFIGYSPADSPNGLQKAHEISFDRYRGWVKSKDEPVVPSDVLFLASTIPDPVKKHVFGKLNSAPTALDAVMVRSVKGLPALFAYEPAYANELSELRMPFYGGLVPAPHRLQHSILEGADADVSAAYRAPTNHGANPGILNETYIYYPLGDRNKPLPLRYQQSSINNTFGGKMTAKGLHCKAVHTLRRFQEIAPMIDEIKQAAGQQAEKPRTIIHSEYAPEISRHLGRLGPQQQQSAIGAG